MLKGIDIASWQGDVNYDTLRNNGIDFVIAKATEGVGFVDPKLKRNQLEARRVGISFGYYHFARPDLGNSAIAEADFFLKTIGELKEGELLTLDFEVSFKDLVNWSKAWLDRVFQVTGVKPLIYLNKSLQSNNDWSSVIKAGYGLWLADYSFDINSPIPQTHWSLVAMRQYSDLGSISGIGGKIDLDVFYGDKTALLSYGFKSKSATSTTKPTIEQELKDMRASRDSWKLQAGQLKDTIEARDLTISNQQKAIDGLMSKKYTVSEATSLLIDAIKNGRF